MTLNQALKKGNTLKVIYRKAYDLELRSIQIFNELEKFIRENQDNKEVKEYGLTEQYIREYRVGYK